MLHFLHKDPGPEWPHFIKPLALPVLAHDSPCDEQFLASLLLNSEFTNTYGPDAKKSIKSCLYYKKKK